MLLNFLGSIVPLPLLEPIEKYTEMAEIAAAGGSYNEAEFLRLTLIVGAYSLFQYTMLAVGLYLFFKNRRRIFVSDRCEVFIPRSKRASVIIFNTGTILFILMVMGMMAMNIFSSPITTG